MEESRYEIGSFNVESTQTIRQNKLQRLLID